ncbi:MAG: hypothetical protein IOD12_01750 [Silvanigrellales bacterium]|nr:hypothetical protein [Silvanigrellales bacterium]
MPTRRFPLREHIAKRSAGLVLLLLAGMTTLALPCSNAWAQGTLPAVRRNNNLGNRAPGPSQSLQGNALPRPLPDAPPSRFPLTVLTQPLLIAPTASILRTRIEALKKKPDLAEPVVLRLNTLEPAPILEQLAKQGLAEKLLTREGNKLRSDFRSTILPRVKEGRLSLEVRDLVWIDLQKLSATIAQNSIKPSLMLKEWELALANSETRAELEDHFGQAFKAMAQDVEKSLLASNEPGSLQIPLELFLPRHVRTVLGRYSPLRGRNCFATALGFNDPRVELMDNINLVREDGHHAAMINNDEFAQALWLGYRELEPVEILEGLKYGDVIAFLDRTEGDSYTGLKHAAVHVAADVYLHKPSKSASTPIEFTRWTNMVRIWGGLARELDYKVYRRLPSGSLRQRNSQIAIEKIFWSQ